MDLALNAYREMPPVTRTILTARVALGTAVTFGLVRNDAAYSFNASKIAAGEVWRLVTSIFYTGPLDFESIGTFFFFTNMSRHLEEVHFHNSKRFAWVLFILFALLSLLSPFLVLKTPSDAFVTAQMYLWARVVPDFRVAILFIGFPVHYAAFFMFIVNLVRESSDPRSDIVGFFLGHILFYCDGPLSLMTGVDILKPPLKFEPVAQGHLENGDDEPAA